MYLIEVCEQFWYTIRRYTNQHEDVLSANDEFYKRPMNYTTFLGEEERLPSVDIEFHSRKAHP